MLVLFDIDATLVNTSGSGVGALEDAGRERFGPHFSRRDVDFAGRIDPLLIDELLACNGVEVSDENRLAMRDGYRAHLARRLAVPGVARALPGVHALLEALGAMPQRVTLGLLTGNFAETGAMKLRACAIEPACFPIAAWGDESPFSPPRRDHLPPVAMRRYRAFAGRDILPDRVVIIGDTPHDAACALANKCRCLGVATGRFRPAELAAAGAHAVVEDLSDTGTIVTHLLQYAE